MGYSPGADLAALKSVGDPIAAPITAMAATGDWSGTKATSLIWLPEGNENGDGR